MKEIFSSENGEVNRFAPPVPSYRPPALHQHATILFERIYKQYYKSLISAATSQFGCKDDEADIVQDVFLKLWLYREQLNEIQNISSFLFTMTRNACINELTRDQKKQEVLRHIGTGCQLQTANPAEERELQRHFKLAIQKLSPQRKKVFVLREMEGLHFKQIGICLWISPYTVRC